MGVESQPGAFLQDMTESDEVATPIASQALVLPHTGELISLEELPKVASALDAIRAHEAQLREVKQILTEALVEESRRQGSKTLRLDYLTVEIGGGTTVEWDIEVLHRLQDAGLPEERFDALVRTEVTYKVSAAEAKRISSNPEYARIIELARTEHETRPWARVRGKK